MNEVQVKKAGRDALHDVTEKANVKLWREKQNSPRKLCHSDNASHHDDGAHGHGPVAEVES